MAGSKKQENDDRLAGIAQAAAGVAGAGLLAVAWHFGRDRVADALEAWADACEPEAYEAQEQDGPDGDADGSDGELERVAAENERMGAELAAMRERLKAYEAREREGASGDAEGLRRELERTREQLEGARAEADALRAARKPKPKPKPKAPRKTRAQLREEAGERAAKAIASGDTPLGRYRAALGTTGAVGWETPDGWACIAPIPEPDGRYEGRHYRRDGSAIGATSHTSYSLDDVPAERMPFAELRRLEAVARERHEREVREAEDRAA